jgi:hypothetical protein
MKPVTLMPTLARHVRRDGGCAIDGASRATDGGMGSRWLTVFEDETMEENMADSWLEDRLHMLACINSWKG